MANMVGRTSLCTEKYPLNNENEAKIAESAIIVNSQASL